MNLKQFAEQILDVDEDRWTVIRCAGAAAYGGPSYRSRLSVSKGGQIADLQVFAHRYVASLKDDLSIAMAWGLERESDGKNSYGGEEWIDPLGAEATGHFLDFFYNGNLIFREEYVSLSKDRESCLLPIPDQDMDEKGAVARRYTVPDERRRFYKVLNALQETDRAFDRWFQAAGFEIVPAHWMGE